MCCSAVVTGRVRHLTGELLVGSLGLFMRFTATIKSLIGMIGCFGA